MIEQLAEAIAEVDPSRLAEDLLEALRLRDELDAKIDAAAALVAADDDIWFRAA